MRRQETRVQVPACPLFRPVAENMRGIHRRPPVSCFRVSVRVWFERGYSQQANVSRKEQADTTQGCQPHAVNLGGGSKRRGDLQLAASRFSARRLPTTAQRSLHNAPIFRLLLKVAVNGTHQCDSSNFCGGFGPQHLRALSPRQQGRSSLSIAALCSRSSPLADLGEARLLLTQPTRLGAPWCEFRDCTCAGSLL